MMRSRRRRYKRDHGLYLILAALVLAPGAACTEFQPLFNGRDLAIHGSNSHGILYAAQVFQDFELTASVERRDFVDSGICLRGGLEGCRGFEIQICSPPDGFFPAGSVYSIERSRVSAEYEERWFLMQVEVRGSNCAHRIDGEAAAGSGSRSTGTTPPPGFATSACGPWAAPAE